MWTKTFNFFFKSESTSALLLLLSALAAMLISNTNLNHYYQLLIQTSFAIGFGDTLLSKPIILWINEGLMACFFLLVGLEIKREILLGELNDKKKRTLPLIAALGGMVVPAIIYIGIVQSHPIALRGWAIPTATDIAFSLAILAFIGKILPPQLKVFLTAVAIIDDLGAIIIIALFYTPQIITSYLALSAGLIACLVLCNRLGIKRISPYAIISALLWYTLLKSGIHATLVGVVMALSLPMDTQKPATSPALRCEHIITPWVAFLILPLFAFTNSGIPLHNISASIWDNHIMIAIILGLVIGKPLGILGFSWAAVYMRIAQLPKNIDWVYLAGISALCGIGFTMSLFIGTLAFDILGDTHSATHQLMYANILRLGVLIGSILSGLLGTVILKRRAART
jgi:Na+:H+ antiporter, NhaA family